MRTSFGLRRRGGTTYQHKVDVDMQLNAVKSVLTDVLSVSPSSEQRNGDMFDYVFANSKCSGF